MAFSREKICECELKNNSILILFWIFLYFCQIQLAGLIEEHLDLGPSIDRHVFKCTYLHKSCLKIHISKGEFKKFV